VTLRGRPRHLLSIWAPVVVYIVAIFYFSSLSQIPLASNYPDFVEHGVEYLGLAVLLARALNQGLRRIVPIRLLLLAWGLCILYGASDELHQKFVPDRFADVTDVLSDSVGAGIGLLAVHLGQRLLIRRPTS